MTKNKGQGTRIPVVVMMVVIVVPVAALTVNGVAVIVIVVLFHHEGLLKIRPQDSAADVVMLLTFALLSEPMITLFL